MKWPTFHPLRSGSIYIRPGLQRHYFEGNLGETAERDSDGVKCV